MESNTSVFKSNDAVNDTVDNLDSKIQTWRPGSMMKTETMSTSDATLV